MQTTKEVPSGHLRKTGSYLEFQDVLHVDSLTVGVSETLGEQRSAHICEHAAGVHRPNRNMAPARNHI